MIVFVTAISALLFLTPEGGPSPDWMITNTDIYKPLEPTMVAVTPEGGIYVLNSQDAKINYYNPKGELTASFGRNGQGPGEFGYPYRIFFGDGVLYVHDIVKSAVVCFDAKGNPLKDIQLPREGLKLLKVRNGWAFTSMAYLPHHQKVDAQLNWVDLDLKNETVLHHWPRGLEDGGNTVVVENGRGVMPFNPASSNPRGAVSTDGRHLAFWVPNPSLNILIFDIEQKKQIATLDRDLKKIPFNEEWGKARYEDAKKQQKAMTGGRVDIELKAKFPEFFPPLKDMRFLGDGNLYIERWTGTPETKTDYLAIDLKGNLAANPIPNEAVSRVLAINGDYALVHTYNSKEEQAGIARCKRADLKAFVAANPIQYKEGSSNFVIVR